MAKLYFYYSAMNAGKSTVLLQSAYNYKEKGMDTLLFGAVIDTRFGKNLISSRIGLNAEAIPYDKNFNFFSYTQEQKNANPKLQCVLVDEGHFLNKDHVLQLTDIVDKLDLPVLVYGLRSDYLGNPFESSSYLLALADNLVELKTICYCGKKAIMNLRRDANGRVVKEGDPIFVGGNESYTSMCRKHFKEIIQKETFFPDKEAENVEVL